MSHKVTAQCNYKSVFETVTTRRSQVVHFPQHFLLSLEALSCNTAAAADLLRVSFQPHELQTSYDSSGDVMRDLGDRENES